MKRFVKTDVLVLVKQCYLQTICPRNFEGVVTTAAIAKTLYADEMTTPLQISPGVL